MAQFLTATDRQAAIGKITRDVVSLRSTACGSRAVSERGEDASHGTTDGSKLTPAKVSRFILGSRQDDSARPSSVTPRRT
jgi:hypothetical protein